MDRAALEELSRTAENRMALWANFIRQVRAHTVAEIGVYRGDFAVQVLDACADVRKYYMIDPWRHLDDWNKPANVSEDEFAEFYEEVLSRTQPYEERRVVLRGTTADVIDRIADGELDLAYIDGDHTLRGVTIDLIRVYPKVRNGGWVAGDDFDRSIWEHGREFEPTLVFPFAVHFAEAVGARIYALANNQFLIQKDNAVGFEFVDLTGRYDSTDLRSGARQSRRVQVLRFAKRLRRRVVDHLQRRTPPLSGENPGREARGPL
jgi:predicted O-methyltransferase YrrM